ncbi:M3 family metallopeptidase [Thermodesulfobacteriota bacterium]
MRIIGTICLSILFISGVTGCSRKAKAPGPHPTTPGYLEEPLILNSVADVEAACMEHLAAAEVIREAIRSIAGPRTGENTLVPYNNMLIHVDRILPVSDLIANVHPDKAVRTAAEECHQRAKKFISDLELDRDLYEAIVDVERTGLEPHALRFLDHLIRDYRRAGVDKDDETRKKLARLNEEMVSTGQAFSRNIREDRRFIELDGVGDLAGMPPDFVAAHQPGENGKIRVTTDYPDFFPFVTYAEREDLRRELYKVFMKRAYPANDEMLRKLLGLRHEYASTLGYPDWASYNAEDKMVKEKKVITDFIDRVAAMARPRMEKDLEDLLARKREDIPEAGTVQVWDRFYYVQKVRAERFGVDAQEVRAYFEFGAVKQGALDLAQELFGVDFVGVRDPEVWYDGVEVYDVLEEGRKVGRFYLDLHPREGKYGHAAMFQMLAGVTGVQLPSACLVCNFPDPTETDGPVLMEHRQATTFFHEFGHLMHHLLAGRHRWVTQSGISCEWDFVEAPSQLLEEWTWDAAMLGRFARHHETGEPIPVTLVERMREAEEFGKGVHVMRQMFYAGLSLAFHDRDPEGLDSETLLEEVQRDYNPYPRAEDTYAYASFGHLEGYSSMYYTYMWSLVMAKDIFTRFLEGGLLDQSTALEYRRTILEPGGSVDADQMVKDFLGRDYSFDSFREWLER